MVAISYAPIISSGVIVSAYPFSRDYLVY